MAGNYKLQYKDTKPVKLEETLTMSPKELVQGSKYVQNAYNYILKKNQEVKSQSIKEQLEDLVANTQPLLMAFYKEDNERQKIYQQLKKLGFLPDDLSVEKFMPYTSNQKMWTASGSHYNGHHSHPGGLTLHTEENMRISLEMSKIHSKSFDLHFDNDVIVAAQVAHDMSKTWLLEWQADGSCLPQYVIASTGAHHIYGLAECICRKWPVKVIFAQACTHINPGNKKNYSYICDFLLAAFVLAQVDPVKYGMFDAKGNLTFDHKQMEFWFCYMGDHSVGFTVPSARLVINYLTVLAQEQYGFTQSDLEGKPFNQFRNYVLAQCTITRLFKLLSESKSAFKKEVKNLFID